MGVYLKNNTRPGLQILSVSWLYRKVRYEGVCCNDGGLRRLVCTESGVKLTLFVGCPRKGLLGLLDSTHIFRNIRSRRIS